MLWFRVTVGLLCLVLGLASSAAAQGSPGPLPPLEVHGRQGDHYWVVETAPDGSRRGGWVHVQVPLDRVDRRTLEPLPPAPASSGTPPESAASSTLDERLARIERALAAGSADSSAAAAAKVAPAPQPARPQIMPLAAGVGDRPLQAGTVELMALGSFSGVSVAGETATAVTLNTFLGVFATPRLEVGASTSVMKLASLNTSGSVMGHLFFNFPNDSAVVPFVGAGLGTTFGNADVVGHPLTLDVSGGFRVLMPGGGGALVIRPFYERANVSSDFVEVDLNTWGVAIGASLLF